MIEGARTIRVMGSRESTSVRIHVDMEFTPDDYASIPYNLRKAMYNAIRQVEGTEKVVVLGVDIFVSFHGQIGLRDNHATITSVVKSVAHVLECSPEFEYSGDKVNRVAVPSLL